MIVTHTSPRGSTSVTDRADHADRADGVDRADRAASPATSGRYVLAQVVALLVAAGAVALRETPFGTAVALTYLTLFPGDALRAALRLRTQDVHLRVLFDVAGSVTLMIGAALLSSVVVGTWGAAAGLNPLDPGPLFTCLATLVLACLAGVAFSRDHAVAVRPTTLQWWVWGLSALLTQGAWIGAKALDFGRGPLISVVSLTVLGAAVVWGAVSTRRSIDSLRPTFLFFLTLAIAWSFSQRTDHLYGFDLHQEYLWAQKTLDAGVWEKVTGDPYAAMLSITALPASLVSLSGLDLLDYFKAYAPVFLALYAVGAFSFISRFTGRRAAYAVTLMVVLVPQALWQLPAVSRQEVALLQFSALLLLVFGAGGRGRGATAFACLSAATLGVTHYTSAYVTLAVLAGGLVISWGFRRLRADFRGAPRHLSLLVLVALIVGAVGWNAVYTQSTSNVGSAVDRSGDGGLRSAGNPIETFLQGANIAEVPPAEYFAETRVDAAERSWLIPYSTGPQQQLIAEAKWVPIPEQYGPAGSLHRVSAVSYVLLKQGSNLLMAAGVIYLAWRTLRRRERQQDIDLLSVALVALAITAVTRFNAELSQAYNPERLLLQTAFFLGPPAAILGTDLVRRLTRLRTREGRRRVSRRLPQAALVVLASMLAFDATGVRALLIHQDSGNLQPDGEYAQRFGLTDADVAAARWLGARYVGDDMVFADTYGALAMQDVPTFTQGVFGELSPYTLDQRAYVLATSENVDGGRARLVKRSVRTMFEFPTNFLSTYKSRIYSNGSAEVYR